jgi:hypothetical protein
MSRTKVELTDGQRAKLEQTPTRYRPMYLRACRGSRKAAMAYFCAECVAYDPREVRLCSSPGCALFGFRVTADDRPSCPPKTGHIEARESAIDPEIVSQPDPLPAEAVAP